MTPVPEYLVEVFRPEAHLFRVTLTVPATKTEGETLSLPAWIPGSYMIREFAKNLVEIHASQGGRPVALEKLDKHTWRSGRLASGEPLVVETLVYAWDLSVRCAHLDQHHGFFNGTQLFLKVEGREAGPHRVKILRPERPADWRLATTLPGLELDEAGFGLFEAADYDELIDHPVEMGNFISVRFEAAGVPHEMVVTGKARFDAERLAMDLKRVCETAISLFGTAPPFGRFLFLTMAVGEGYGGLEQRDSTALICSRNDLPVPGAARMSEGYRSFLGLCSHEYFHAWNVKRIKPAAFMPYRLHEENYTRLLWVFEGFTSYYDDLCLLRSGVISREDYFALLAKTISAVERNPGRFRQSLAESSFDAWTKYYRQDENSPNAIVSYYQKGALVALGLDLLIRKRSEGQRSLDDVMRYLWQHYGQAKQGVAEDGLPAIISEATGVDVKRELSRWVRGVEDVPLARLLKPFGITFNRKPGPLASGLGVRTRVEGHALKLSHVIEGGSAQTAGLSAGDELVAIDGLRVTPTNLENLLGRFSPGTTLEVLVFRRDELLCFTPELREPILDECVLSPGRRVGNLARVMRQAWLGQD